MQANMVKANKMGHHDKVKKEAELTKQEKWEQKEYLNQLKF